MREARAMMAQTVIAPFTIAYSLLIYAITCPMNHTDVGDPFSYPIYIDYWQ